MRHPPSLLVLLLAAAAAACSAEALPPPSPIPPAPTAAVPAPAPPALRLPPGVSPARYRIELTLKPGTPTFEGEAAIDLAVTAPTSVVWLNAAGLTVTSAVFETGAAQPPRPRVVPGGAELVGFVFDDPLPVGHGRLRVAYTGAISDKDDHGIFVEDEEGAPYLFTQFESIQARRAFPCFDEPSYKVPWQIVLHVPEGETAVSNTPIAAETKDLGGMKTVTFAPTAPLPAYLVAFAVGPFDVVDAGKAGKKGTPVRVFVPKGQAAQAAYAVATTPPALARLEELLGVPYPYEKLDVVAVPRLVTFGAMENAGMITFTRFGMLAKPEEQTLAFEMRFTGTIVHELGHHWFGDLVTTSWWDDIWLNEAFASWVEAKVIAPWKPAWHYDVARARSTTRAMSSDGLASARRIRQPITSNDDILNAFDDITYSKGAAVIGMFEAYLGPERFRKGLQRYLGEHAHATATAADLLAALSADGEKAVAPAFSTFLDQPGVPLVAADLRCDGGKAVVGLSALRYRPVGSEIHGATSWRIPVCVRWGRGKAEGRACTLLTESSAALPLPDAKGCPDWIVPNADAAGYYHATYRLKNIDALLKGAGKLTLLERVGLARDLGALVATEDGGDLQISHALARVPDLLRDPSLQVLRVVMELVGSVRDVMIPPNDRERYAHFIARTFGARAKAIGWRPKPHEEEEARLVRPGLLSLVADRGGDATLAAEAEALAVRWLEDPKAIEADIVDAVLEVAAERGGRALFDRLRAEAKRAKDDTRRRHLLVAMARFRDPAIVRDSLGILLTGEHDVRDALGLLWQDSRMADVSFAFVKEHFDALAERVPGEVLGGLPAIGDGFCDDAHRRELAAFFNDRVVRMPGGPRNLAKALERVQLCTALRRAQEPSLHSFLEKF